jgi:asparagine synthase (glutamine-hydrolysing)
MGFGVPLAQWLRGPLRGWAEALLAEDRIRAAGHLDPERVRAIWRRTADPASSSSGYEAWNLLMFESWRERWGH